MINLIKNLFSFKTAAERAASKSERNKKKITKKVIEKLNWYINDQIEQCTDYGFNSACIDLTEPFHYYQLDLIRDEILKAKTNLRENGFKVTELSDDAFRINW